MQIREATLAAAEQFGDRARGVVPVCAAPGKEHGVRGDLLAAMADQLESARGTGLLRALHAEADANKARRVVHQLVNVGKEAVKAFWNAGGT